MMKALKVTFVVLVMLITLVAGTAYATVDVTDVALGDDNQERDETVSETFTIKNNFNDTVTINSITANADAKFNLIVSGVTLPATINSGSTLTVTLQGDVPLDLDSVDANLEQSEQDIGSLDVAWTRASGPTGTTNSQVTMEAEPGLEITDIDIEITGEDDKSESVDDGDEVELSPGDSVSITIKVENLFSSSSDLDIDDAEITMDIEDDNDFDIDDDRDEIDLDAGDDGEVTFTFELEDDADDEDHKVTITLEGTAEDDGFESKHGHVVEFEFQVERESKDIRISRMAVSPEVISCSNDADFVEVEVRIENRGRNDERDAAVEVVASTLNFREKFEDIELDRDESSTRRFLITLPEERPDGKHKITANSFFSNNARQDTQDFILNIDSCEVEEPTPVVVPTTPVTPTAQPPITTTAPTNGNSGVVTQPSTSSSGSVSATPTSGGFSDGVGYIVLLVVLIMLAGAGILGLGAYLLLRK